MPQTTAVASSEIPVLKESDLTRPKFLGGHYTSKINENAQSAVKEFLSGQQRGVPD